MPPTFTGINYYVCCYCKNIHIYDSGHGGQVSECSIDKKLIRRKGCSLFSASGVPAHPKVWVCLVEWYHRASSIPQDVNAVETSYDFSDNISKYLKEYYMSLQTKEQLQKCLSDKRLPPSAFKVYYYLSICLDKAKTHNEIVAAVALSRSTVEKAIELLKVFGYISLQKKEVTANYCYDILEEERTIS